MKVRMSTYLQCQTKGRDLQLTMRMSKRRTRSGRGTKGRMERDWSLANNTRIAAFTGANDDNAGQLDILTTRCNRATCVACLFEDIILKSAASRFITSSRGNLLGTMTMIVITITLTPAQRPITIAGITGACISQPPGADLTSLATTRTVYLSILVYS